MITRLIIDHHNYTIDRFEEDAWAVLEDEDGQSFNVPRHWVPRAAEEGDVLDASLSTGQDSSSVQFSVSEEATNERRKQVRTKLDKLRKRSS